MIYPPRDFTHKILKISTKYQDPPRHAHKICVKFPYSFFFRNRKDYTYVKNSN